MDRRPQLTTKIPNRIWPASDPVNFGEKIGSLIPDTEARGFAARTHLRQIPPEESGFRPKMVPQPQDCQIRTKPQILNSPEHKFEAKGILRPLEYRS